MSPADHCFRLRPFVPLACAILLENPVQTSKANALIDLMDDPFVRQVFIFIFILFLHSGRWMLTYLLV